jgi:hypothetical protein
MRVEFDTPDRNYGAPLPVGWTVMEHPSSLAYKVARNPQDQGLVTAFWNKLNAKVPVGTIDNRKMLLSYIANKVKVAKLGRPSMIMGLFSLESGVHLTSERFAGRIVMNFSKPTFARLSGNIVTGDTRWKWLASAYACGSVAALSSSAWGIGQIMGFNYQTVGFRSVWDMVDSMRTRPLSQVDAAVNFILANPDLAELFRVRSFRGISRFYNGPNYAAGGYHLTLRQATYKYKQYDK